MSREDEIVGLAVRQRSQRSQTSTRAQGVFLMSFLSPGTSSASHRQKRDRHHTPQQLVQSGTELGDCARVIRRRRRPAHSMFCNVFMLAFSQEVISNRRTNTLLLIQVGPGSISLGSIYVDAAAACSLSADLEALIASSSVPPPQVIL